MRRFVLDTNVLVHDLRKTKEYEIIKEELLLYKEDAVFFLPIAVKAELLTLANIFKWGSSKRNKIQEYVDDFIPVSPNDEIIDAYVTIETFSRNKLDGHKTGKSYTKSQNDLWIAATASVTRSTLVSMDGDFSHLVGQEIDGLFLDIQDYTDLMRNRT